MKKKKKRNSKKHSKSRKNKIIILILSLVFLLVMASFFIINKFPSTGKSVQVDITPLTPQEKQKVMNVLSSSEFVNDVPKNSPISIRFFSFSGGQRNWNDGFIIGEGNPAIYLTLHSKYIFELNENNLCGTIKKANENGDLGFYSEYNKATLLWKYKSMLKYRECFGF